MRISPLVALPLTNVGQVLVPTLTPTIVTTPASAPGNIAPAAPVTVTNTYPYYDIITGLVIYKVSGRGYYKFGDGGNVLISNDLLLLSSVLVIAEGTYSYIELDAKEGRGIGIINRGRYGSFRHS